MGCYSEGWIEMKALHYLIFSLTISFSSAVFAEACTYSEARIALKNGNEFRANTLMKMAAKDGDLRAIAYLEQHMKKQSGDSRPVQLALNNDAK